MPQYNTADCYFYVCVGLCHSIPKMCNVTLHICLQVVFYSLALEGDEFLTVIQTDFMLAFLSILSVWVYMLIHLGSVFLASMGIFEVFMSFPVALFVYKYIFQVRALWNPQVILGLNQFTLSCSASNPGIAASLSLCA